MKAVVLSDIHAHNFSAFGGMGANGLNKRLEITLNELRRAADEAEQRDIGEMIIAGDIFHARGSIDPEVFNPTFDTFKYIARKGFEILIIPGNHDLKGHETTEIGNACQQLSTISGVQVFTQSEIVGRWAFIPWHATLEGLEKEVAKIAKHCGAHLGETDLFIHAGINGVLPGLDHGLDSAKVAGWGFRRVFAGHYHNHKIMEGGKVVSIGATTHQNWGDIGTKAGFLFIDDENVEYRASNAPSFVEITGDTDPDDIPLIVDGNYVRIRGMKLTDAEITRNREELERMGAKGASFQVVREAANQRSGGVASKTLTLEQSIHKFIDDADDIEPGDLPLVKSSCDEVLSSVRSVTA